MCSLLQECSVAIHELSLTRKPDLTATQARKTVFRKVRPCGTRTALRALTCASRIRVCVWATAEGQRHSWKVKRLVSDERLFQKK